MPDSDEPYGVTYPTDLLSSLPILDSDSTKQHPHPIRALPASTFSNLHLTHLLTHPPDHVLFPFIHGLEGTNVAQNQFFATNSNQQQQHFSNPSPLHPHHASALPSLPPKYRGLVWVVCDEDLDQTDMSITSRGHVSPSTPSTESDSDSDEEDDDDDDIDMDTDMCYSDTNDNDDPMMQVDSGAVRIQTAGDGPEEGGIHVEDRPAKGLGADGEEKHMHPVQHRSTAIPVHDMPSSFPSTQTFEDSSASESFPFVHETSLTIQQQEQARAYRSKSPSPSPDPSPAAASTSQTTASPPTSSTSSTSLPATSPTTTPTTTPTAGSSPAVASSSSSQPQLQTTTNRPVHRDPPLLTSTFRPADLIRRVQPSTPAVSFFLGTGPAIPRSADTKEVGEENDDDDQYEFVPLKVPDGISLRNFGIQVPIFATISDIIVYSPKGPTENAIRLARRFRGAIERKRRERAARSGLNAEKEGEEKESGLLRYNVFVLDAGEEEMRDKLEYLMIRTGKGIDGMETDVEDEIDTDKAFATEDPDATKDMDVDRLPRRHSGSHTDGTDGHTNQEVLGGTQPIPLQSERKEKQKRRQRPNTVNFAEREKEEMRDLTKASEIISVFPSPAPPLGSPLHHRANSDTIPPNPAVGLDLSTTRTHWDPMLGQVFLGNSDDVPLGSDFEGEKERERERARQRQQTKNHPSTISTTSTNLISTEKLSATDPFNYSSNDPTLGYGYDICLECHDMAPFPGPAHLKAAEEHLAMLDALWAERCQEDAGGQQQHRELPPRPPPNANAVIHLPFPSSPPCNLATMTALMPVIKFLEKWLQPPVVSPYLPAPTPPSASCSTTTSADTGAGAGSDTNASNANTANTANSQSSARRWSSVTSLIPSFAPFPQLAGGSSSLTRNRAFTSPNPTNPPTPSLPSPPTRTRPLKILIYSSDGYTESSVPALCLLMAVKTLTLPEAYLELQVVKKRSFFVYMSDLGVLRRVEGRLVLEREQERDRKGGGVGAGAVGGGSGGGVKRGAVGGHGGRRPSFSGSGLGLGSGIGVGMGIGVNQNPYTVNQIVTSTPSPPTPPLSSHHPMADSPGPRHSHSSHSLVGAGGRPTAKSVSFAQPPPSVSVSSPPPLPSVSAVPAMMVPAQQQQRRPRASTSPWLPSFSLFGDHQSWFNDPRFDGSFPSRVLPFLYLGNLNHASNAYMLHALGITHVVSVGECALVPPPPPHGSASSTSNAGFMSSSPASCHRPSSGAHFVPGKGPDGQGSLWIEEREGRIKVLDIKGVCDDGIDTLEPQLEPICEWIDKARAEGGQVLVHCRVGVSRSATVVIAYVMKHLSIPLVDAYLIVRSRRLSVLIQPNMRLLYNLCGWEVKLAKDRAGGDEDRLKDELSRTLSWPYLAKEVHTLNEKYLHN